MHKERDYIRIESELDEQLSGLKQIYYIFKKLDIQMFLSAGTMLGAVRDNDFIPWDWNVSVICKSEEFNHKADIFIKELRSSGFINKVTIKKNIYYSIRSKKNGVVYIIENAVLKGEWRTRPYHKSPAKFLNNFELCKLRGELFPCPAPMVECVKWQYGEDWNMPKKVKHRNEVINPEHHIRKRDGLI